MNIRPQLGQNGKVPIGSEVYKQQTETQIATQKSDIANGHWYTCLNCVYGNRKSYPFMCMKFNMPPPVEVIVSACRDWEDEIPF